MNNPAPHRTHGMQNTHSTHSPQPYEAPNQALLTVVYAIAVVCILLDLFIWRPL
jgi:hypothetical protein